MDDLTVWVQQQLENQRFRAEGLKTLALALPPETGGYLTETAELLLADVDAKRRIMAIHSRRADVTGDPGSTFDNCCDGCGYGGICDDPNVENITDCPELRALAGAYASQPGYRDEWRLDGRVT